MVVHAYYDEDPRVRRQAESLVERGWAVDVIGLRRPADAAEDFVGGVHVRRVPIGRHQGASLMTYLLEYLAFAVATAWLLAGATLRGHRYEIAIAHTPPDWLALALLPLRLAGAALVLDMHEATPELYRTRFGRRRLSHLVAPFVGLAERAMVRFVDEVIVTTAPLRRRILGIGARADRTSVVVNGPLLRLFDASAYPMRPWASDGVIRLVYTGALTPVYELDVVLRALAILRDGALVDRPISLAIYGRGDSAEGLMQNARDLGLEDVVTFHERAPLDAVPAILASVDVCISPTRVDAFTDNALPTKILEAAAMGKPVLASRQAATDDLFHPATLVRYAPGDPADLARALAAMSANPAATRRRAERTQRFVLAHLAWERHADAHAALLQRVAARSLPRGHASRFQGDSVA
jgi:glycosyltransferase involved in cell wall biosynthesis